MTITPELKQANEHTHGEPLRIKDPEKMTACVLVPKDVYRPLKEASEVVNINLYFYEYAEFVQQK